MSIGSGHLRHLPASMVALLMLALTFSSGCSYFYDEYGEEKRIPSPIGESYPFDIEGKIYRVWCGNELQIKNDEHTSYLTLQGVNNPDRTDEIEQKSIDAVYDLLTEPLVTATVVGVDEQNRFIAQVRCGDRDINLEMIKSGWGQCDGSEFERAPEFKAAEATAKANKLGMWALEDD